jgi:hypothetical protein
MNPSETEEKIWVTAYLRALASEPPHRAELTAARAVDIYEQRFSPTLVPNTLDPEDAAI